jgi:transcriptional regulator with XRE-family HTH domain
VPRQAPSGDREFGSRVRERRKQLGLSVTELARRVGVSHTTIIGWESAWRMPGPKRMRALADALALSVDDLVGPPRPANLFGQGGQARGADQGPANRAPFPPWGEVRLADVLPVVPIPVLTAIPPMQRGGPAAVEQGEIFVDRSLKADFALRVQTPLVLAGILENDLAICRWMSPEQAVAGILAAVACDDCPSGAIGFLNSRSDGRFAGGVAWELVSGDPAAKALPVRLATARMAAVLRVYRDAPTRAAVDRTLRVAGYRFHGAYLARSADELGRAAGDAIHAGIDRDFLLLLIRGLANAASDARHEVSSTPIQSVAETPSRYDPEVSVPEGPPPFDPEKLWMAAHAGGDTGISGDYVGADDLRERMGEEAWARFIDAVRRAREQRYAGMTPEERAAVWLRASGGGSGEPSADDR